MQYLAIAAALAASLSLTAQAAVVDFNNINVATSSPIVSVPAPYVEDGFQITTRGGVSFNYGGGQMFAITPASPYWTGSPGLYSDVGTPGYGSAFRLERVGGGAFDLISMDAASFWTISSGRQFSIYGVKTNDQVVSKTLELDATTTTLETITLDSSFQSLKYVLFSAMYAQVDNIQLSYPGEVIAPPPSAVPEADSLALVLAGLGVAGWCLRRRGR
ncbi:MAG TPA: PEP-CTERM sorting domain-containing protein [Aquabacterium sp.]|uniref:PEP-CTERM sorting domain-containing protein n=1 Tax=Aquabacterium sp. TaxID=1872578 RepID=UPI002E329ACC|nr:PEP-CTERM sorting domain-containing protein [Aquabacterium sp.]HEX5372985.1 PEP-CTERM sorting domain-containing protein [Aquabacterium sp.]